MSRATLYRMKIRNETVVIDTPRKGSFDVTKFSYVPCLVARKTWISTSKKALEILAAQILRETISNCTNELKRLESVGVGCGTGKTVRG